MAKATIDTASASQEFVPLKEIHGDTVVLKNGQLCALMLTTSVNLALKSTDEQFSILQGFQGFLNSLDFPIQIYAQSRKLDIRPYLEYLKTLEPIQYNDLMRTQLHEYTEFIRSFTEEVAIMKRNFFVVVPYTPPLAVSQKHLFTGKTGETEDEFMTQQTQLNQRVLTISQGLDHIGIKSVRLGEQELTELFYHIFNPGDLGNALKA